MRKKRNINPEFQDLFKLGFFERMELAVKMLILKYKKVKQMRGIEFKSKDMKTAEEKKSDYLETLAEELRMNGFPVEIDNNGLVIQAIFGEYRYGKFLKGDLYYDLHRFVMCYGGALQQYGMEANGGSYGEKKYFRNK